MVEFIEKYEQDARVNPKNLGIRIEADTVFKRLKEHFIV